jgi:hypothetical protein
MCGGGGQSGGDIAVQQQLQAQQIAAQKEMAAASLLQARQIADVQNAQNQQSLDWTKQQDTLQQQQAQQQSDRQAAWDKSRNQNAQAATKSIDAAFSQFTPKYFADYKDSYYNQADSELQRQYGLGPERHGVRSVPRRASSMAATPQTRRASSPRRWAAPRPIR